MRRLFLFILMGVVLGASLPAMSSSETTGSVNLESWSSTRGEPVELRGNWNFWWGQLLDPHPFSTANELLESSASYSMPGLWEDRPHPDGGGPLGHEGFATFSLTLQLETNPAPELDILIRDVASASVLFAAYPDGRVEEVVRMGTLGRTMAETNPSRVPQIGKLHLQGQSVVTLVWHVANFRRGRAGPERVPVIGPATSLERLMLSTHLRDSLLVGLLLVMALYHLAIWWLRRKDQGSLWFGITTAVFCIRELMVGRLVEMVWPDHSPALWEVWVRLDYATNYLGAGAFSVFLAWVVPARWFERLVKINLGVSGIFLVMVSTVPLWLVEEIHHPLYNLYLVVVLAMTVGHLVHRSLNGDEVAQLSLGGIGLLGVAVISDLSTLYGGVQRAQLAPYGFAGFVLLESFALARRFAKATELAEHLTENLRLEVKQRTEQLQESLNRLKQTELRLITQERLASLANLMVGFQHEVGNPLGFISAGVSLIDENTDQENDIAREGISLVEDGAARIQTLLTNIRGYSDNAAANRELSSVAEEIEETLVLLQQQLSEQSVEIELVMGDVPKVELHRVSFRQVIQNLILNSLEAMQEGGKIRIEAAAINDQVELTVTDTGPGVPENQTDAIFDPFFTTKEAGQGMGLGLSVSHEIIHQHGGELRLVSSEEGAQFAIRLPIKPA